MAVGHKKKQKKIESLYAVASPTELEYESEWLVRFFQQCVLQPRVHTSCIQI